MDYFKEFVIPFRGLAIGNHEFNFVIDERFFERFSYSEITNGHVNVSLLFTKQERLFTLDFNLKGVVDVECDRCSETFPLSISASNKLFIKLQHEHVRVEVSDDVIAIPDTEWGIDVKQYIYEFIILALPIQKVHPLNADGSSQCDPEMIKLLKQYSKSSMTDPRWDALQNLKSNIDKQ